MPFDTKVPAFWRNLLPPSSGYKIVVSFNLRKEAEYSSQTVVT
jgi:hypothetical protein